MPVNAVTDVQASLGLEELVEKRRRVAAEDVDRNSEKKELALADAKRQESRKVDGQRQLRRVEQRRKVAEREAVARGPVDRVTISREARDLAAASAVRAVPPPPVALPPTDVDDVLAAPLTGPITSTAQARRNAVQPSPQADSDGAANGRDQRPSDRQQQQPRRE